MANSIEQYARALEDLRQTANRTKNTIMELQSKMASGNTGAGGDLSHKIEEAQQLVRAYRELEAERAKLMSTGVSRQYKEAVELTQAYRELDRARSTVINNPASAASNPPAAIVGGGATNYIPGGATSTPVTSTPPVSTSGSSFDLRGQLRQVDSELRKSVINAIRALQETGSSINSIQALGKEAGGIGKIKLIGSKFNEASGMNLTQDYKFLVDSMGNYGKTLSQLHRQQVINNPANAQLFEFAASRGFTPEDFRRLRSSNTGAYSIAEFRRNRGGVDYSQEINVDKQGGLSLAPVQRKYQSFTQNVGKDIGDLLKWSIAISAIYAPINALSEAMSQLVENEAKLADVSISLDSSVATTNQAFDDIYQSAQGAGEGVGLVIDAFGQAYRAAGRITNEFDRYGASLKLLDSSLVLSKISTLDQAQAIDVLTAALFQVAGTNDMASVAFSNATSVLDQWVRVSKVANVDIATLATGVAVLGDSSEAAGLSLEELNALIATIAETSIAGGREAANIAKALVGNYQQPESIKALGRLGIAVTDVTGKNREFLDVMRDVASLRSQGIIGPPELQRVAMALGGGGIRRAADVARYIENFGRMNQIVSLQEGAGGESAEALSKKLDTVQTSATRLGNSFTNLAQTMGNEGGLLDVFSGTLNFGTKLVDMFDSIASKVGKVAPLLAAVAVGSLIMGKGGLSGMTDKLANNLTIPLATRFGASERSGMSAAQYLTGRPLGGATGAMGRLGNIPSLAAIAIPALQNIAGGNYEEAGANIAGGIAGALVGGPIGALLGSAIAEAFVRTTMTYDVQFSDFFAGVISKGVANGGKDAQAQQSIDELMKEAFKEIGGGNEAIGKLRAAALAGQTIPGGRGYNQQLSRDIGGQFATPASAAMFLLQKQNPELAATLKSRFAAGGGVPPGTTTYLTERQKELQTPETMKYLSGLQTGRQNELRTKLISGEMKPAEYAKQMGYLSAYTDTATRYMAALGDEVGKVGGDFGSSKDAYISFLDILSSGNDELLNQINAQISAIEYYQGLLSTWTPGTPIKNMMTGEEFTPTDINQIKGLLVDVTKATSMTAYKGAQQVRLQNLNIPEVFGGNINPTPMQDIQLAKQEALKVQQRRYAELSPEDYQALVDSFDTFSQLVEDSGKVFYDKVTGIDKSIYGEVFQDLQKQGRISSTGKDLGFQQMDITRPQLEQAVARANQLSGQLQKQFPGYEPNMEDTLIATSDEQISKQHTDMKLLQYVLQQILDTEKKQLEGIYNLPEGSSFWVPLTAAWLANRNGAGTSTGDQFGLKNPDVVGSGVPSIQSTGDQWWKDTKTGFSNPHPYKLGSSNPITAPDRVGDKWWEDVATKPASKMNGPEGPGLMEILINALMKLFTTGEKTGPLAIGEGFKSGKNMSARDALGAGTTPQQSTKLDIKFSATTQLLVDGRILASIVKPYLASDLLKTNESGGTVTRSYVI